MKVNKAALTTLAAVVSCCSTRAFVTGSALPAQSTPTLLSRMTSTTKRTTALPMIFKDFFSSLGGGGFESKIDYDSLPYPCPELATAATDGKVLQDLVRKGGKYKVASFAGGCFWGLELAYQRVPGVEYTAVGYQQGPEEYPNYDQVCAGSTKHTEAVYVVYDPNTCSYDSLLDTFFARVDPLTINGQGRDRGRQYRTGVYFHSADQEKIALARFVEEQKKYERKKIASECLAATPFWPAEKYHQQYLENGGRSNRPQSTEKGSTDTIRCYG